MKKEDNRNKNAYRLLIKVIDRDNPVIITPDGRKLTPVKWIEVKEAELGSLKNPNKDILEFKYEPIKYETNEEDEHNPSFFPDIFRDIFKRFR